MPNPIVIKKSPVVIIKNLVVLQFLAAGAYFLAALLANYGELYQKFTFSQVVSYEIAKFLLIIAAELFLVAFIFLRWFFKMYAIYPTMLVVEGGVIVKRRKVIPLTRPLSVSCHLSPLSKIFKYGTIVIRDQSGGKPITLTHVMSPKIYQKLIAGQGVGEDPARGVVEEGDPKELLTRKEHEKLEFKTSFRWDARERKVNRALEKAVMKTVAAFLNSEGGHLVIGVDNEGGVAGLAADYATLRRQDADGFENHFTNVFRDAIGPEFRRFVKLSFHDVNGDEVCVMRVSPSVRPAYLTFENEEAFYIRTGNSTTPLSLSDAAEYIRSRWREY